MATFLPPLPLLFIISCVCVRGNWKEEASVRTKEKEGNCVGNEHLISFLGKEEEGAITLLRLMENNGIFFLFLSVL